MTSRIPVYSPTGTCNFCHAAANWGGAPHTPGCAFHQALTDITDHKLEVVEQAAAMLAVARLAITEIDKYNRVNNDLDAYLSVWAEYGLGAVSSPPNPKSYGIKQ